MAFLSFHKLFGEKCKKVFAKKTTTQKRLSVQLKSQIDPLEFHNYKIMKWIHWAIGQIEADKQRTSDTNLIKLSLPALENIDIYLKDESAQPSGSLKHRLARSLFMNALCSGWIHEGTTIIEASSGSTAISEAYYAKLLHLPFIAVIPEKTGKEKVKMIEHYGGKCHRVKPHAIYEESQRLAKELNGLYMDQFTYAERATDWKNNTIAESIFQQMTHERFSSPRYIVVSAGTGGTSAAIGRYIRFAKKNVHLCVVDPDNSVFYEHYLTGDDDLKCGKPSLIEGIGRPRVEKSFIRHVIDSMRSIPDAATVATIRWLETILHRKVGGSTGTNLFGVLQIASEIRSRGESGSIVTLLCDSGDRYLDTLYNDDWVCEHIGDIQPYTNALNTFLVTGDLDA